VEKRYNTWKGSRENQSLYLPQLAFEAEVCQYVKFMAREVRPPAKSGVTSVPLHPDIPLLGPRFLPPSFLHVLRRNAAPEITPNPAYLKPLNVIHPMYYPELLERCPNCRTLGAKPDLAYNGWNPTGHREVHGVMQEETAIGIQLRCNSCEARKETRSHCFVTTNPIFWENVQHWEVPGKWLYHCRCSPVLTSAGLTAGMPHFLKRSATTSDLYDLIVELRPSMTAAGLAENIRR
ncbi:hypothetical protein K466DRAFT_508295, partial [Polyporus arcularius HHB13444]